jgi:hypothetical protein
VELQHAVERLEALAGEAVVAQVLSRGVDPLPLAELSGILTVDTSLDAEQPRVLCVNGNMIWIWPDRFVEASPLPANGALELVTQDAIVVVGPADRDWID